MANGKKKKLMPTATERRRKIRNSIYRFIYNSAEPVSRQDISSSLDISLPTVHQNITELMDAGLIRAGEIKESSGGRPPVGYEIDPDIRYSLGIEITYNHFRFWVGDLKQKEIAYKSIDIANTEFDDIDSDALKNNMDRFLEESNIPIDKVLGITIAIPGIFDDKTEKIVISPTLKMKNFHLSDFKKKTSLPVSVMNDASSAGYEERRIRQINGESLDFVSLNLDDGVGGAIFINGKKIDGKTGHNGEFGHMRIVPDGRMCNCGQRGCLEAYTTKLRITRDLGISVEQFFDEVGREQGRGPRTALFYDMLKYLAIGIVNLRMAYDCDIVVGGYLTEYLGPYMDYLRATVRNLDPFNEEVDYLELAKTSKSVIQGAAWLQVSKFINEI